MGSCWLLARRPSKDMGCTASLELGAERVVGGGERGARREARAMCRTVGWLGWLRCPTEGQEPELSV